jgi:diguanylate cyclase (GGDEF)-like protein
MYKDKNDITILYVEDEKNIRETLSKFLKHFATQIYLANNGEEGLKLYNRHTPDIVISDIKMPIMNGIDMVKAIKQINPKQHIIFTTAHSDSKYFIEAIELLVDGYVLKPIDFEILKNKINSLQSIIKLKEDYLSNQVIMNEIAKLQDNMLVVLDKDGNAIFSNDKFLDFLLIEGIDKFSVKYKSLSDMFLQNDDFFYLKDTDNKSWIQMLQNLDDDKRVVSMMDYSTFSPKAFLVSINYVKESLHTIIIFTEITNITIQKKQFQTKAYTDELTKIHNRAYFNEKLQFEIIKYKEKQINFCCILFDIDFFKKFNDTYGHQMGDTILIALASLVKEQTRSTDTFARWGGEEFVIILPNISLNNAKKVAQSIRKTIEEHSFTNNLKVTCSFGVSQIYKNDTNITLLKRADEALYKAKQTGRNKVET